MMRQVALGLLIGTPIILFISYMVSKIVFFLIYMLNIEWYHYTSFLDKIIDHSETLIKVIVFVIMTALQYYILYFALCISYALWGD